MTLTRASARSGAPARVAIAEARTEAANHVRAALACTAALRLVSGDPLAEHAEVPCPAEVVVLVWDEGAALGATIAGVHRAAPDAAIVVVLPRHDEELYVDAIRFGAEDCIPLEQMEPLVLARLLLVAAERHRMTSSLRAAAFTDDLTGLYNRRGYLQRAALLLRSADPKSLWQIFFDLDELKQINDTFGHWAGDRALMEVAGVLRQAFRSTDIVARVGGDEFAVLAVAPADAAPESWTARWREPLAALGTRREFPLTVSVGVAQPDGRTRISAEDLLERADGAMYVAKRLRKKLGTGRPTTTLSGEFLLSDLVGAPMPRREREPGA